MKGREENLKAFRDSSCPALPTLLPDKLPSNGGEDSISFLPVLTGEVKNHSARTFAVHHSLYGVFALREGSWKFVPSRGSGGFSAPKTITPATGEATGQLYNLAADPAETKNLYTEKPDIVARLTALLEKIKKDGRSRP